MRRLLLLSVVAAAALVSLSVAPAQAAMVQPLTTYNCTYSHNGSLMAATCTNTPATGWYYQLQCMRYSTSKLYKANGTLAYGAGTSRADCGSTGEVIDGTIVPL
jgi:hypothetical protein